ncbi:MAG: acetyl-CoA carboxylase biotin carboxyl carrier protein [Pseudomonadota bacterium]
MEFKEIQELIRMVSKSNLVEVRIEKESFKITIRTRDYYSPTSRAEVAAPVQYYAPQMQQPMQQQQVSAPPSNNTTQAPKESSNEKASAPVTENHITIKAPMVGTFYRSNGPDKEPFIKVGDEIKPGTVICIIEAMKLFNEIESEVSGKVVKILVDNSKPVEYEQPLFLIETN